MELSHLKSFQQVVITGSFSKAADALFISQPALSRQIASLEKDLGCQLFNRQNRKSVLTDAGKRLLIYAEKIINFNDMAKKEMMDLSDLTTGNLTIGASTTIGNYILPSILASYKEKYPGIRISVQIASSRDIEKIALEGKIDIGLVAGEMDVKGLYKEKFAEDELCLIVPKNHPFIKNNDLISTALNQETFLCREDGADTQRLFDSLLKTFSITPERKLILGTTEAIKNGIANNLGIAFLSKNACKYEFQLGVLVPIDSSLIKRPFLVTYPNDIRLSSATLAFYNLLKEESS